MRLVSHMGGAVWCLVVWSERWRRCRQLVAGDRARCAQPVPTLCYTAGLPEQRLTQIPGVLRLETPRSHCFGDPVCTRSWGGGTGWHTPRPCPGFAAHTAVGPQRPSWGMRLGPARVSGGEVTSASGWVFERAAAHSRLLLRRPTVCSFRHPRSCGSHAPGGVRTRAHCGCRAPWCTELLPSVTSLNFCTSGWALRVTDLEEWEVADVLGLLTMAGNYWLPKASRLHDARAVGVEPVSGLGARARPLCPHCFPWQSF